MNDPIAAAKAEFERAKAGLLHALATTPDDRLLWSPSPTARPPLHLVAHAAYSIGSIHRMLSGDPFPISTTAEAERFFRAGERDVTTREEAIRRLEETSAAFVAWLDALTPERLDDPVILPFAMGQAPTGLAITFPTRHTVWHTAQLDYLQTIYGDHDWHVPYGR